MSVPDRDVSFDEPPVGMADVYEQFVRESRAAWHGEAYVAELNGVYVTFRLRDLEAGPEGIEMMAPASQPPAVRVIQRRGWGPWPLPPWVVPLNKWPVIALDPPNQILVQSDEPVPAAFAALDPTWREVVRTSARAMLACDGTTVTAQLGPPATIASAHALCAAVVALARSSAIAHILIELDGATPTRGGDLAPSFSLAPDGLQIGVNGGVVLVARLGGLGGVSVAGPATLAWLARAGAPILSILGGVASLTWPGIERDPVRIRAGVAALRSLVAQQGPYR